MEERSRGDGEQTLLAARAAARSLISDLEAELSAIAESTADSPDDEHDAEGSTIGFERARVGALLERARRSLAGINDALERGEQGNYGICDNCGADIGPERLEALPAASLCVRCAVSLERRRN